MSDWANAKWEEIASWSVNLSIDVPVALREAFADGLKRNLPPLERGTLRHYAAECAKAEPCNCPQALELKRQLEIAQLQLERGWAS